MNQSDKILLIIYLGVALLLPLQNVSAQQIGLNFNEQVNFVEEEEVAQTETRWVRGFVDFFEFYEGQRSLQTDTKITKMLALKDAGYKTILNIKWRFADKSFPDPGSKEMQDYIVFLGQLLNRVWDKIDIIVVGNEPFIESRASERDTKLVAFYKEMANRVIAYRKFNRYIPIYVGSFDNVYIDAKRRPGFTELMSYVENNPELAGVSIHIHHAAYDQMEFSLQYTSDKIRDDQKILVTEYSLMKHWRNHSTDLIPADFAAQYGYDPAMQVYQYVDLALKNARPREEWVDFLSMSPWFENRKNYLWESYTMFKSFPKFHIGTYAFRQSFPFDRDFTSNTDPWVLNGLYANRTVVPDPQTGLNQFNYSFIEDFWRIQQDYRDNIVSSTDNLKKDDLLIYPNPVQDNLRIQSVGVIGNYFIYDFKGNIIKTGEGMNEIDVSGLSKGLYFISIPSNKLVTKFIKQ